MINTILSLVFGTKYQRDFKKLQPIAEKISALENDVKKLTQDQMISKAAEFRSRIEQGQPLSELLPYSFAMVREAAWRTIGMRPFDVQLMGAAVLHEGKIAEMKTGEGKTLVATMPVFLNALTGRGVHIVTVNDYLARRDAEWMGPIYKYFGMSVGVIQHNMDYYSRQKSYRCDVTYGTNNEFGFDYLRDNMVEHNSLRVQRKLYYAIVDEVDSILIDEARTPLIISGSTDESTKKYYLINKIIPSLKDTVDYKINEKDRNCLLTEDGVRHVEKLLKLDNLYDSSNIELVHHVNQALKAHALFKRDTDYIVKDGQVIIVDEFTGRLMPGRRYSDGLHQALEAKENVSIARESQTLASITFQNYFRMYAKLAGMTGTADTEAMEFKKIYNLDVVVVPTNESVHRTDYPDKIYRTEKEKFNAIVKEIGEMREEGRPILVGTISIEKSERLSDMLRRLGISHNVLNAKYHEREAQIIAEAGRSGTVTIATNMAGRGTDIVLGGRKTYVDDLENWKPIHDSAGWEHFRNLILKSDFEQAHSSADAMIGQDQHKALDVVRKGRDWLDNHNKVVDVGGLHILGTERHEARRIDNQLRGRSGRQGDPGSSRFYLSLEDDLMRIFGSDRISGVMQRLGMEEGQEIESKMVSRTIENAQKRVEGRNFEIRKHLLEYDDVMNSQREYIYKERNAILDGEDVSHKIMNYISDVVKSWVPYFTHDKRHSDEWDIEGLSGFLLSRFGIDASAAGISFEELSHDDLTARINNELNQLYKLKEEEVQSEHMRTLERLVSLQVIDNKWRDHLLVMDDLRDGIWTAGYSERNPLVEYKLRGFELFNEMMDNLKLDIVDMLLKVRLQKIEDLDAKPPQPSRPVGQEFRPELEQFAAGGIPVAAAPRAIAYQHDDKQRETAGGVKRKKTRRSRRD